MKLTTNDGGEEFEVIVPQKFSGDVEALKTYVGEERFKSGLCIETSLVEILEVVQRKRKRSDAFETLIKFLKSEMNIELTIKNKRA